MKLTVDAVRVLDWILANGRRRDTDVAVPADVLNIEDQRDVLAELRREGLVINETSVAMETVFTLEPARRSEVRAMARKARQTILERQVLEHVDSNDDQASASSAADALGGDYEPIEVSRCINRLKEGGFLSGFEMLSGETLRLSVTAAGADRLEDPYVTFAPGASSTVSHGGVNTYQLHGTGNFVQHGDGNSASVSVEGIDAQALSEVLEAVRRDLGAAAGADPDRISELQALADEAADVANNDGASGAVRTALRRLKTFGGDVLTASTVQLIALAIGV